MNLYRVGDRYHPAHRSWPEMGVYQYRQGSHELVLFYDRPAAAEIAAVKEGRGSFALITSPPVILFCYQFAPGIPASDAPFSAHLVPDAERAEPYDLPAPDSRALLHVLLVGAHDGVIRALRAVSLSPEFSQALHAAIRVQAAAPWDPVAFDHALDALYQRFPSSDALATSARIRCQGSD